MADPVDDTLTDGRRRLIYELAHGYVSKVEQIRIGDVDLEAGRDGVTITLGKNPDRDVTMMTVEVPAGKVGSDLRLTGATYMTAPEQHLEAAIAAGAPVRQARTPSYRRG